MALVIRPAEHRDLETLGRLGAALMRLHYEFDRKRFLAPHDGAEQGYASFLGSMLDKDDARVFVAEKDGVVSGYVFCALEPLSWKELRGPAGFIHDILVVEEARCQGIATKLLEAALAWLRDAGAPRVVLGTASANRTAQKFFTRRFGFRETMIEMTLELE